MRPTAARTCDLKLRLSLVLITVAWLHCMSGCNGQSAMPKQIKWDLSETKALAANGLDKLSNTDDIVTFPGPLQLDVLLKNNHHFVTTADKVHVYPRGNEFATIMVEYSKSPLRTAIDIAKKHHKEFACTTPQLDEWSARAIANEERALNFSHTFRGADYLITLQIRNSYNAERPWMVILELHLAEANAEGK